MKKLFMAVAVMLLVGSIVKAQKLELGDKDEYIRYESSLLGMDENNNYYVKAPKTYGNITYNYDTKEYRTCTQGLRTMAFHRFGTGPSDYRYIGMYNMLLDKGSDENYGFKLDKTAGFTPAAKFVKNKKIKRKPVEII